MFQFARLVLALVVTVVAACDVTAQQVSFAGLAEVVRPGETVIVTDGSGKTLRGRLISATPDSLTANVDIPGPGGGGAGWTRREVRWLAPDVTRIQREERDSLWNGAALGGLAGGAAGVAFFMQSTGCDCTVGQVAFLVVGPFVGAGIGVGAIIDAATVSRQTVYRSDASRRLDLRVAPMLAPSAKAVRVSVGF
jgi:hypothetical protein